MKKEITETITKTVDICDICKDIAAQYACLMCRRELCYDCKVYDNRNQNTDYPETYCKKCWDIGASYRKQEIEAQEVCDIAFEYIWIEWKEEAIKNLTD